METHLDIILHKMRTASSQKKLQKSLESALSCLDGIRARYEFRSAKLFSVCESWLCSLGVCVCTYIYIIVLTLIKNIWI